ncbi:MAG: hypothetical protein E7052_09595 [Lentisphaerae bacterium]|nr:hypothetical protein [Lentisphaerota bacterium]
MSDVSDVSDKSDKSAGVLLQGARLGEAALYGGVRMFTDLYGAAGAFARHPPSHEATADKLSVGGIFGGGGCFFWRLGNFFV